MMVITSKNTKKEVTDIAGKIATTNSHTPAKFTSEQTKLNVSDVIVSYFLLTICRGAL